MKPGQIKVIRQPGEYTPLEVVTVTDTLVMSRKDWAACAWIGDYNRITKEKAREKGITQPFMICNPYTEHLDGSVTLTLRYDKLLPKGQTDNG